MGVLKSFFVFAALFPTAVLGASVQSELTPDPDDGRAIQLEYWPSNGWVVQQYGDLVEIRFPGVEIEIPSMPSPTQDEILGLREIGWEASNGDTFLRLTLSCDCSVGLQGDGQSQLTIRVLGDLDEEQVSLGARRYAGNQEPAPLEAPLPVAKPSESEFTSSESQSDQIDVNSARKHLLEQLLRAAEAGIVDLDPELRSQNDPNRTQEVVETLSSRDRSDVQSQATKLEISTEQRENDAAADPQLNADLEDSALATQEVASSELDELDRSTPATCFPNEAFLLPDVSGPADYVTKVNEHRAHLIGEFDTPTTKATIDLVKVYISVGLAEEALATMEEFGSGMAEEVLLREIALLLLSKEIVENGSLEKADCVGDQAIWRAYASALAGDHEAAINDETASGRALDRLPIYLRQIVAASLGRSAVVLGNWEAARRFQAMAERAAKGPEGVTGESLLLSAELADWHGKHELADRFLKRALGTDQVARDEALILMGRRMLQSEENIGADTQDIQLDLGRLSRHARGTKVGAEAFEIELRLFDRSALRDESIRLLSHGVATGLYPPSQHISLLSDLVNEPALSELSRPLGLIFLDNPERFQSAMNQAEFRRGVVHSLADIGVPWLGYELVRDGDLEDQTTALALAESFLEQGNTRQVLEIGQYLSESPEKASLLGRALLANGQVARAAPILEGIDVVSETREEMGSVLRAKLKAALKSGDLSVAQGAATDLAAALPTVENAAQLALIALEAGSEGLPNVARKILETGDPRILAGLDALFSGPPPEPDGGNPDAVTDYLQRLEQEMSMIEELLADG